MTKTKYKRQETKNKTKHKIKKTKANPTYKDKENALKAQMCSFSFASLQFCKRQLTFFLPTCFNIWCPAHGLAFKRQRKL